MGTRFRAMLAPIGASTGDGRRFAPGSLTTAPTPFPFEWARERDMGHDGAVVIGAVQSVEVTEEAVWGEGEIFDDVDREEMPRLAEDVAEAMKLISEGTLGPSVDLDDFEGVPVREGTDQEIEPEDLDDPELKVELLVTEGRVRAATLVSIPAFVETSRPMELIEPDPEDPEAADKDDDQDMAALIASVGATPTFSAAAFDPPKLSEPTPITVDWENGRVYGHIAVWNTCHSGFSDMCITPPKDARAGTPGEYSWFHRHAVDTDGGTLFAGRMTVGGRHPELSLTASATMSAYDGKAVAAYVRATEDDHGILVCGPLADGMDERTKRVLSRRKVSGDWRETADGLSMVELLALSPGPRLHSEPGFPVATHSRAGRQTALTAALGPSPEGEPRRADYADFRAEVRAELKAERERERAAARLRAEMEEQYAQERRQARTALAEALEIPEEVLEGAGT